MFRDWMDTAMAALSDAAAAERLIAAGAFRRGELETQQHLRELEISRLPRRRPLRKTAPDLAAAAQPSREQDLTRAGQQA